LAGLLQRGCLILTCLAAGCSHTSYPVIVDRFYQADGRPVWCQSRYTDDNKRKILHGTARYWYRSGGNRDKIGYRHDTLHGTWTHWYEHGPRAFRCNYRHGVLHGRATVWDGDGKEVCSGEYSYGSEYDGSLYRPAPEGSGPAEMAGEIVTLSKGEVIRRTGISNLSPEAVVALRVFWGRTPPEF